MTCQDVFRGMPEKFQQLALKDIYGVFQFYISGKGGGEWFAVCKGDAVEVGSGRTSRPDVSIYCNAENVVKLAQKRLSPTLAVITRKIKVKGNLALFTKIGSILSEAL